MREHKSMTINNSETAIKDWIANVMQMLCFTLFVRSFLISFCMFLFLIKDE